MSTLEFKHIAPYLPYGLKALDKGNDTTLTNTSIIAIEVINHPHAITPLLRPMSDLFKRIEYKGSKVCVAKLIASKKPYLKVRPITQSIRNSAYCSYYQFHKEVYISELPYWIMEILFKYHFDVFGLIEKGLAEPIKTIEIG